MVIQRNKDSEPAARADALAAAEQALRDSETRLRLAMHATGLGLWDYRPGQERVGSNEEFAVLLGYEPDSFEETRAAFVERLHPDDRAAVRARFRDYLDGQCADYAVEFRMRTRSGEYRWFRSVGQIVDRDPAGKPTRVVGTYLDITAQVNAMRRLSELSARLLQVQEAERSKVARELHDEIGQQLTAIRLNLHAIAREGGLSARVEDCLSIVDDTLGRVRAQVLDLRPPMLDDMGLGAALDWYCRRQEERAGVSILIEGVEGLARYGEEVEITVFRLVQEAVNNALRHGRADEIRVTLHDVDGLRVVVEDNGVGFDPDDQVQRAHHEGYGLSAMRERVALAGGRFDLSSAPGAGTRITVFLPRQAGRRS